MPDTQRFDRLESYLRGLPAREDSHPECTGGGTLLLNVVNNCKLTPEQVGRLPAFVRHYFDHPPLHAAWVPEVHIWSTIFAVGDSLELDPRAFAAWSFEQNRRLCEGIRLQSQLRILSSAHSTEMGTMTWSNAHRGTKLSVLEVGPEFTRAKLEFPRNLLNRLALECLAGAFVAILDATKPGRGNHVRVTENTEFAAEFRTSWHNKKA